MLPVEPVDIALPTPVNGVCVDPPVDVPSGGRLLLLLDEHAAAPIAREAMMKSDVCALVMATPGANHPAPVSSRLALERAKKASFSTFTQRSRAGSEHLFAATVLSWSQGSPGITRERLRDGGITTPGTHLHAALAALANLPGTTKILGT